MNSIIFFGICVLLTTSSVKTFLLEEKCLASPPCDCSNTDVFCPGLSLYKVPKFLPSTRTLETIELNLQNNVIRMLLNNDFQMLQTAHAAFIDINLGSNSIQYIEDNAFNGIESSVRVLYLDYNRLSYLPPAIGKLINLSELALNDNPITTFDSSVFAGFGSSLSYFTFNVNYMSSWPTDAINKLQKLTTIDVVESLAVNTTIPSNAFDSVKNTLTTLNYDFDLYDVPYDYQITYFHRLPEAVCSLNRLRTLRINSYASDSAVDGSVLFEQCKNVMTSLESLSIYNIQHLNMTEVFTLFPSLSYLVLNSNLLNDLHLDQYKSGLLTTLDISYNKFARVPNDVNKLTSLVTLDLASNLITNIENDDFSALINLEMLDLSYNIISRIDPDAFQNNRKLTTLTLEGNSLTTIPSSVTVLPNLKLFTFSSNQDVLKPDQLDCSCQTLGQLKAWKLDNVYFPNYCATAVGHSTPVTIKSFIQNDVKACP
ncbi:hypothetical protein ACF0H5_016505 [Mactra antiquata]